MKTTKKHATDLRVGGQVSWRGDGVVYGRPLIHVGLHRRSRTKREAANSCAWCERAIADGQPKVNILGYGQAHFHADCFVEWAISAAAEAKESKGGQE